jgi:hypothetical protein
MSQSVKVPKISSSVKSNLRRVMKIALLLLIVFVVMEFIPSITAAPTGILEKEPLQLLRKNCECYRNESVEKLTACQGGVISCKIHFNKFLTNKLNFYILYTLGTTTSRPHENKF